MFNYFQDLADRQLAGATLSREEALAVLESSDAQLLDVVAAAARLRRAHFANTVKVNYLVNLKSGLCPEDCTYCSQRLGSAAQILKYSWLKPEEAAAQAATGIRAGASRVCLVASGRGPSDRDVDRVAGMVAGLKGEHPGVEVCACLGILKGGQAGRLKDAGVDAYNHNLNTSESNYADICSTHTFTERVQTVEHAKDAGLSPCSGLIAGMGESNSDLVDAVFTLRALGSESIPVNFLMPFDGTPLEGTWLLTPAQCLRILAMVRFACPATELRMAGGREMHLRTLQPLALHVANSLFLGDYLTSEGQEGRADLDMIADNGFVVLGTGSSGPSSRPEAADDAGASPGAPATIRRRGAGTAVAPNA
ncbi:biotin synthase BioB [Arthrobacter wenxiniae]|uniref:Biotin synthase n=1 Tax=Arthrobacter wenxiniae TaxID=2713570 RepID=A0A7Y7IK45_9MICC|nr:biotin synthase BioB [Arthrobacter wenxiniae]